MGLSGRTARGGTWIAASRLLIGVMGFVNMLILARLLTPGDFGLVAIAMSVMVIVMAITELSLSQALVQHRDPQEAHYHTAFALNLIRAAAVAGIILVFAAPAAAFYGDPRLTPLLHALAASSIIVGAMNPKLAVMSRNLVFWQDFATRSGEKVVAVLVAVAIAFVWRSYWALIIGVIAGQVAALILSYVIIPFRPRLTLTKWRDLMSFSVWVGLEQSVNTINWRFDQLLAGYLLGNAQLGYYSVGDRLSSMPTREASQPVAQTVFPAFSMLADDPDRLRAGYQRAQSALMAVALPIGIGFALVAEPLVLLGMGEDWRPVIVVIQVLAGIFAIQTLASTVRPLAMGLGQTRLMFHRSLITFVIRVPIVLIGLLTGGLAGLLAARCVTGIIGIGINLHLVSRLIRISIAEQVLFNIRSFLGVGVMAAVVYAVSLPLDGTEPSTLVARACAMVFAGALTYPVTVMLLWLSAGQPAGPEHDALRLVRAISARLAGRRTRRT